jgi:hypothetical protein
LIEIKSGKKDINSNNIAEEEATSKETSATNTKPTETKAEVEALSNKIEKLHIDKTESDQVTEKATTPVESTKKESNSTVSNENYFANVANKEKNKQPIKIDEAKLKEVKEKVLEKMKNRYKYNSAKELTIEESSKLLIEHENKVKVNLQFYYLKGYYGFIWVDF